MAKSPIVVVWASTTSNKDTLDTTTQGNGIIFESDIVSDFINSALYINSQATRNLQVMGGYYDGGQEYKNYQYCSQIVYDGSEYVLNYYMATQDTPTLTPTNATSNQQGTTDMEIPISPTQVQTGWKQLKILPNQDNLAYKNKANTFNMPNYFTNGISVSGNSTIGSQGNDLTFNGNISFEYDSEPLFSSPATFFASSTSSSGLRNVNSRIVRNSSFSGFIAYSNNSDRLGILSASSSYTPSGGVAGCSFIEWSKNSGINYMNFISRTGIKFDVSVTIQNASFGTATYALDPEWEQDYATANYVNQKLQELYDYLDARLATIEEKLGISSVSTLTRAGDVRSMISNIAVPKSPITELFERLNNLEGYEGVLGYSNAEERMELSKARDSEESIMQIMDSIKARREAETKAKAEAEAKNSQENQDKE